jgi:hypothetical protein
LVVLGWLSLICWSGDLNSHQAFKATRSGSVKGTLRKGIRIVNGQVAGASTDALPQARDTGNATVTID